MLFFIDESGHDRTSAPYEVLAAVAIREQDLWNLIQAIRHAELEFFGLHLASVRVEFKGKTLLKRKVFRFAAQDSDLEANERRVLAHSFLQKGWREKQGNPREPRTANEFTAYGQAVLAFVGRVYQIMARYRVKTFAAMVKKDAPMPLDGGYLRRDYSFLLERFFYYLEDVSTEEMGLLVFDEREKAQSRILLDQMTRYFLETATGYVRSARVVPEPFFVHSDLTTAVQLADITAYCLNWGLRLRHMTEQTRSEIELLAQSAFDLRYVGERHDEMTLRDWPVYGVFHVDDLRPKQQREQDS